MHLLMESRNFKGGGGGGGGGIVYNYSNFRVTQREKQNRPNYNNLDPSHQGARVVNWGCKNESGTH